MSIQQDVIDAKNAFDVLQKTLIDSGFYEANDVIVTWVDLETKVKLAWINGVRSVLRLDPLPLGTDIPDV